MQGLALGMGMDKASLFYLAVIATAIGIAFLFAAGFEPEMPKTQEPLRLTVFETQKQQIAEGEELVVRVEAQGTGIASIGISLNGKQVEEVECGQTPCSHEFRKIVSDIGAYQLAAFAFSAEGKRVEESRVVYVAPQENTCIDNSRYGSCGKEKPFYCLEGKLVEKCSECDCDSGFECVEEKCSASSLPLEIASLNAGSSFIKPGTYIDVFFELQNNTEEIARAGAHYTIEVVFYSPSNEQRFTESIQLEQELLQGKRAAKKVSGKEFVLEEGNYSLSAALLDASENIVSRFESLEKIVARDDFSAPAAPTGVSAVFVQGKALLSWNQNSEDDFAAYRVYKSSEVQATFISYSFSLETNLNSVEITGLEGGKHFFVVTALDHFGNESVFSDVVSVEAS